MIQEQAFDPATGAPLSEERHYPDHGVPCRQPEFDATVAKFWSTGREGALTNGELVSSLQGLLGYFRRVQRELRAPNPELDRAAATALRRLKSATDQRGDPRRNAIDSIVWYALAERLARQDFWTAWMLDAAIPRCPHCHSRLKFRGGIDNLEGVCASSPSRHGSVDDAIHEAIAAVYDAAFVDDADDRPFAEAPILF